MARRQSKPTRNTEPFAPIAGPSWDDLRPPDRPYVEDVLRSVEAGGFASNEEAALELVDAAYDAGNARQSSFLARAALGVDPDCVAAYILLAVDAETHDEQRELYERAVAAGERVLGERAFREDVGHFWSLVETRPYMRAKEGLAACLREAGRRAEAAEHYREMLRLNPNDNQGNRYSLAALLLELDRHDDLEDLLGEYEEDGAPDWLYSRALLAYRREGNTSASRRLLEEAARHNEHVPRYVAGGKPVPRDRPEFYSPGSDEEAVCFVAGFMASWRNTPGAIGWMREVLHVAIDSPAPPKRRPSWAKLKQVVEALDAAEDETWEVDVRKLASHTGNAIWTMLVFDTSSERPLRLAAFEERPDPQDVWYALIEAMRDPLDEEPRRPSDVLVDRRTYYSAWQRKLSKVGIACWHVDRLEAIEEAGIVEAFHDTILEQLELADRTEADDPSELHQHVDEIWLVDAVRNPSWIETDKGMVRPWMTLVVDREGEFLLTTELTDDRPGADALMRVLARAMCHPIGCGAHRPGVVEVRGEHQATLAPMLADLGVRCVVGESFGLVGRLASELAEQLDTSPGPPALVDSPGVTFERIGEFYAVAAEFYRHAPWRAIRGDSVIEVACDELDSGPWYAVVMGQSGLVVGLALYDDLDELRTMLTGRTTDEEDARRVSALAVTYGEAFDVAPRDLDAGEEHAWPVASPDAHPAVSRINPGMSTRVPLAWELDLLEGCLRSLPDFLESAGESTTYDTGRFHLRFHRLERVE